jgi:hypothetical protein
LQSNCKGQEAKKAPCEAKAVPGKKSLAFLFKEVNAIKRQLKPPKIVNSKKREVESLLSTKINLTTSSDGDEEYFAFLLALVDWALKILR